MNGTPSISVLMSVWNGQPYVRSTIESILLQTHEDFEFIIVDNVSTDGTREILREFETRDKRIKVVLNEANLGHSGGLNRGLQSCRGNWVARIDADDIALPNRLERQLQFTSKNLDVKVTSCLAYYIDQDGRRIGQTAHPMATRESFKRYMRENEMIGLLHPGAFYDRSLIHRLGSYREEFGAANDIDLWCRVAETGATILVQQELLMEYRVHPGAISASFKPARLKYEWARVCAIARRAGRAEPSWEQFLAEWNGKPFIQRLNRSRKILAKAKYRQAALDFVCGNRFKAGFEFLSAVCLQPVYAIGRLAKQRLKK